MARRRRKWTEPALDWHIGTDDVLTEVALAIDQCKLTGMTEQVDLDVHLRAGRTNWVLRVTGPAGLEWSATVPLCVHGKRCDMCLLKAELVSEPLAGALIAHYGPSCPDPAD